MKSQQKAQTHLIARVLNRLTAYRVTVEEPADRPVKTPPACSPHSGLSPEFIAKYHISGRQIDVIEVLLKGKSDKEIAAFLNITLNTVQSHLKNIYRKTGAQGRCALMVLAGLGNK